MPSHETPYLEVVDMPRKMAGKGAPREIVFGVLGHTTGDSEMKTLGGLVSDTKADGPAPPHKKPRVDKSEHKIAGRASRTHIPGVHMGMVPYVGHFMSAVGHKL